MKKIRCTGSFEAVDDEGVSHTIRIYTEFLDSSYMGNAGAIIEGLKRLLTDTGLAVNRLDKGKYQIVDTGLVIRSQDPDAP